MDRHLLIVANGFRAVGLLLGLPALLACLWISWLLIDFAWFRSHQPPDDSLQSIDIQREGIVGLLRIGALAAVKGLEFAGGIASWLFGLLDIALAALTLAGGCLFLTGRGLFLHAGWARLAAGAGASGLLLISFLALTSLKRGAAFTLIPFGISIYMLWVLIRRFN